MGALESQRTKKSPITAIHCESDLAALAILLMEQNVSLTAAEQRIFPKYFPRFDPQFVSTTRRQIMVGGDPLGETFCQLRTPKTRREVGATYTPQTIVDSMLEWTTEEETPVRIVDPGAGSGRFLLAAARQFPTAGLVAVETDPLARLILRGNATVLGFANRLTVEAADYREITLPKVNGPTLFIGNPPYVRHHDIPKSWKRWFAESAAALGFKASKLAGLHIHFFLKTRQLARDGDYGSFITSAEWLDVNYGGLLRNMLANGLGGASLHILAPNVTPFPDAFTTGAITCFRVGRRPENLLLRAVNSLDEIRKLRIGKAVSWTELENAVRWTPLVRVTPKTTSRLVSSDFIELGDLFAVHRGQVTGANKIWKMTQCPIELPSRLLRPTVTRARELLSAGPILDSDINLSCVADLPENLDQLSCSEREKVDRFLDWARNQGAEKSYVAKHRRAWWAVALYESAPILCTYMARRPPAFVRNLCGARHLNIAHGLYPREPMTNQMLMAVVLWLRENVTIEGGRTYAGGLTKFEPRELERLLIPEPVFLLDKQDVNVNDDFKCSENSVSLG